MPLSPSEGVVAVREAFDEVGGPGSPCGGPDFVTGVGVGRPECDVVVDGVVEDDAFLGYVSDAFSQLALVDLIVGDSTDGDFPGGGSEQSGEHGYVRVDLPAPEAPTNATMLLGGMVRLTPLRTFSEWSYWKDTLVRVMGRRKLGVTPESWTGSSRRASSLLRHLEVADAAGVSQELLEGSLGVQRVNHCAADYEQYEEDFDEAVACDFYGIDEKSSDYEHEEQVGAVVEDRGEGGLLVLEAALLAAGVSMRPNMPRWEFVALRYLKLTSPWMM